jgi:hypothetical protein
MNFHKQTAHSKRLFLLPVIVCLCLLSNAKAQNFDSLLSESWKISGDIVLVVCTNLSVNKQVANSFVIDLPVFNTTSFLDSSFGPITEINLNVSKTQSDSNCTGGDFNIPVKLIFDSELAAVAPRTGLLRNSAIFRPAQNVFLQLGLIDAQGVFTPLDMNQPQILNNALSQQGPDAVTSKNIKLGVRYVASRSVLPQNTAANSGSQDVAAGNFSVFLPFLLKLN